MKTTAYELIAAVKRNPSFCIIRSTIGQYFKLKQ